LLIGLKAALGTVRSYPAGTLKEQGPYERRRYPNATVSNPDKGAL
jgi:hypothetical protein